MKREILLNVVTGLMVTGLMVTAAFSIADAAETRKKPVQFKVYQHTVKPKGPTSFAAPTGGYPTYSQVSGKRAKISLQHEEIGNGGNYGLKGNHANKTVQIKIAAHCPAGQAVQHLAYQIGVQSVPVYQHNGNAGPNVVKRTINVVPFDDNALLTFARGEMGGGWQGDFPKNERQKTRHTSMMKNIKLISSCSGPQSTKVKDYKINIPQVKIIDTDYD